MLLPTSEKGILAHLTHQPRLLQDLLVQDYSCLSPLGLDGLATHDLQLEGDDLREEEVVHVEEVRLVDLTVTGCEEDLLLTNC